MAGNSLYSSHLPAHFSRAGPSAFRAMRQPGTLLTTALLPVGAAGSRSSQKLPFPGSLSLPFEAELLGQSCPWLCALPLCLAPVATRVRVVISYALALCLHYGVFPESWCVCYVCVCVCITDTYCWMRVWPNGGEETNERLGRSVWTPEPGVSSRDTLLSCWDVGT